MSPQTIDLTEPRDRRARWVPFAVWTAIVIVYAVVLYVQVPLPLPQALLSASVYFYTLALLMIPVRRWSDRLLREPRSLWSRAVAHVGITLFVMVAWHAVQFLFYLITVGPEFWRYVYAANWLFQFLSSATAYGAALGITLASLAWARERERAERERELQVAARDAELSAIKAQFQPHFVLNALTSLLALVDQDPALARTMIVRLADLMRAVFERADQDEVPLERELDLIRAYLDVERIRLGSRLSVTIDVDDAARGVLVPALLLQPIVENAVKHGISPFSGAARLDVRATVVDRRLKIVVRDSGRTGPAPAAADGSGRGLQITRRRLDGAFGAAYHISMSHDGTGTAVSIDMPADKSADVA